MRTQQHDGEYFMYAPTCLSLVVVVVVVVVVVLGLGLGLGLGLDLRFTEMPSTLRVVRGCR